MKIGLLRFTQNFDIDFVWGSAGSKGVEIRLGLIEALVSLGHEPHILNRLPKEQEKLILAPGEYNGYDYKFMQFVGYTYSNPIPELDMIIVEGSVDNIHFGLEQVQRFADVVKQFEGPIIILHHGDQYCSVPIGEILRSKESEFDPTKISYAKFFHDVPWRPEQWGMWSVADPDLLLANKSVRRGYHLINRDNIKRLKIGYSPTFDVPRNTDLHWDNRHTFVYIGDERSDEKIDRMEELYGSDCPSCRTILYGNWKNRIPKNFDYRGYIPGFGLVYSLLNQADNAITIHREWCTEYKIPTTRTIQTMRARLFTMCDSEEKEYMNDYLPDHHFVNSHDDVHKLIDSDYFYYEIGRDQQDHKLQRWDSIIYRMIGHGNR